MQSNNEQNLLEIIDLAQSLREEYLFITNEQSTFASLNELLQKNSAKIAQLAWICAQHRQNLNRLIVSRPDTGPTACCQKANYLENTKFIEAYKAKGIKYQHVSVYSDLFHFLHRSPYLLAQCLSIGDRRLQLSTDQMNSIVHTIASGIYGNIMLSKDVDMVLRLLRELIEIQVVVSDRPRRMLRTGSCAFSRLYHSLHESLFSAKLFLTSALYEPIMKVLIDDEQIFDLDANKAVLNFTPKELLKRFGSNGTVEYDERLQQYHRTNLAGLFELSNLFIKSLADNWSLFPSTLRWVVHTMWQLLKKTKINTKDINNILTDMVFTNFICPAVVSPDLVGICDAPISETARLNLIQIGQILQMLSIVKYEDVDAKYADFFEMFNGNTVADLMEELLKNEYDISVSMMAIPHQNDFSRKHVLVTQHELNVFVDFLRNVLENDGLIVSGEDRQKLGKFLDQLPDKWETILNEDQLQIAVGGGGGGGNGNGNGGRGDSPNRTKQTLINLSKSTKSKLSKTMSLNISANGGAAAAGAGAAATCIRDDRDEAAGGAACYSASNGTNSFQINNNNNNNNNNELVIIFPINIQEESKFQLLTEQDVLNMNNIKKEMEPDLAEGNLNDLNKEIDETAGVLPGGRKHTRFSLSNDDQSIGNTSDNLEVVSEAQSNHSVTSSLELEENDQNLLNDNLSDMVSANVSGRGSPNISGRDTPSSQVTEGDQPQIPAPQMAKILKKARSDIEDKFCKFEIKKLVEGDETISIMSDTWSTDVLASDSETIEPNDGDRNFSTPLIPNAVVLPGDNNFDHPLRRSLQHQQQQQQLIGVAAVRNAAFMDVASDTRSESAWSTDVFASDSDKMAEVDTDDNQSIAAKSDTTDAGRSESELLRDLDGIVGIGGGGGGPDSPFFAPRVPTSSTPDLNLALGNGGNGRNHDDDQNGQRRLPSEDLARFLSPTLVTRQRDAQRYSYTTQHFNHRDNRQSSNYNNHHNHHQHHRHSHNHNRQLDHDPYLDGPMAGSSGMRRQNSSESSISNQSLNYDDVGVSLPTTTSAFTSSLLGHRKKKTYIYGNYADDQNGSAGGVGGAGVDGTINNRNGNRPIGEMIVKSSTDLLNPFSSDSVADSFHSTPQNGSNGMLTMMDDDRNGVEHRSNSLGQRAASFDGRRNGMTIGSKVIKSASVYYENVELIPNANKQRKTLHIMAGSLDDGDDKNNQQEELVLIQKTLSLHLCPSIDAADYGLESIASPDIVASSLSSGADEIVGDTVTPANGTDASSVEVDGSATDVESAETAVASTSSMPETAELNGKPTRSTGAIPKSISFDASADKNGRNYLRRNGNSADAAHNNGRINGNSFFSKIKQGFKNRRINSNNNNNNSNKSGRNGASVMDDYSLIGGGISSSSISSTSAAAGAAAAAVNYNGDNQNLLDGNQLNENGFGVGSIDSTEDILEKYRRKPSSSSETTNSDSIGNRKSYQSDIYQRNDNFSHLEDGTLVFNNAKRKLRLVLSTTDLHTADFRHTNCHTIPALQTYLQIQLAQALNLQNLQQISFISEAIRSLNLLSIDQQRQLMIELQQDLIDRQSYLQYLMRYRQHLLSSLENIDRFEDRLRNDRSVCNRHLIMVCVRMFLEKREQMVNEFRTEFSQLTVVDEKIDFLDEFMGRLMDELSGDGGDNGGNGMTDQQLTEARICIESILLQQLYRQFMFPNDDGDISRDEVLRQHIQKLARVITPSHQSLRIPQEFLVDAPWPFAQQQISYISAYKTPHEKVRCVVRCITSIINLLQMASNRIASADDLVPVLIYVIIMANPPYLLSTVQYVNAFIGDKLEGEDHYWWTQFSSAVTFIKTMDYHRH